MTRQDLLSLIEEGGGKWEKNGIEFSVYLDGGKANAVQAIDMTIGVTAYLWNHVNEADDFSFLNFSLRDAGKQFDFVGRLCDACGIENKPIEYRQPDPKILTVKVKDDSETQHARGMVEAYEKILVGRSITVSP